MAPQVEPHSEQLLSGSRNAPLLDVPHLQRQTFHDEAFAHEILGLYLTHATTCLAELRQVQGNKAWRDAAHALKGTSRNVGAIALGDLVEAAERLEGDQSASLRAAMLDRLDAMFARTKQAIEARLATP